MYALFKLEEKVSESCIFTTLSETRSILYLGFLSHEPLQVSSRSV